MPLKKKARRDRPWPSIGLNHGQDPAVKGHMMVFVTIIWSEPTKKKPAHILQLGATYYSSDWEEELVEEEEEEAGMFSRYLYADTKQEKITAALQGITFDKDNNTMMK